MLLASPRKDLAAAIGAARRALASGDLPATERLCKQLVERAPEDGRAWALLTETALQRNRPDAAIVCADRAVALAPDDPIAHIMRAKCLFFSGEFSAALNAAEKGAKILGASPEAEDALGAVFGLLGRHRRALEFCRRAAASRPDVAQYLFNLAATERMLGMLNAAETHCDATIALDRRYALAYYLRSDLRIQTAEKNHIEQMEALIEESKPDWRSEVMLHFALGKEYEDLEEFGRAFDHVKAGADLQRLHTHYDCHAEIAEIDRIISTQTRTWLASAPAGFAAAEPVFVVGLPRTGTTLVERIISSHSAMISAGATGAFAVEVARAIREASRTAALDLALLGKRYVDCVATVFAPEKKRFIDKTLQNYLYCGLIYATLPRAKIVLVRRHPLDTGWALYKAHFQSGFQFSYDLVDLAEYYLAFRRLSQHWKAVLPSHALLEVSYEDIVHDLRTESRRLIAFLGLPWEEAVLRFHESNAPSATASAVQVRRPVYASSVTKWRHHAEALAPLRATLARELSDVELAWAGATGGGGGAGYG